MQPKGCIGMDTVLRMQLQDFKVALATCSLPSATSEVAGATVSMAERVRASERLGTTLGSGVNIDITLPGNFVFLAARGWVQT